MRLTVEALPGCLRMVVSEKETSQEARTAADSVFAEQARTGLRNLLIVVRESRPIFKVEQYGLSELIEQASAIPGLRVALVSDTRELYASHQYVEIPGQAARHRRASVSRRGQSLEMAPRRGAGLMSG